MSARISGLNNGSTPKDYGRTPSSAGGLPRLPSIASSEYQSRLEALELQLQEERKRRHRVERTIAILQKEQPLEEGSAPLSAAPAADRALPANPQSVLTELSLFLMQRDQAERGTSARSANSARSSRAADGSAIGTTPVKPPTASPPTVPHSASRRTALPQGPQWDIPSRVKPPLPPQAKGIKSCEATPLRFSKKRSSDVDVYLSKQRHEQRMQHLTDFQLSPF